MSRGRYVPTATCQKWPSYRCFEGYLGRCFHGLGHMSQFPSRISFFDAMIRVEEHPLPEHHSFQSDMKALHRPRRVPLRVKSSLKCDDLHCPAICATLRTSRVSRDC